MDLGLMVTRTRETVFTQVRTLLMEVKIVHPSFVYIDMCSFPAKKPDGEQRLNDRIMVWKHKK